MSKRKWFLAATVVFFVLQLVVIGSVIVQGNLVLIRGVECRFKATGYDPSDPLRGRYVRFNAQVETPVIDEVLLNERNIKHRGYRGSVIAYFQLSETLDESGFTKVLRCAAEPTGEGLWIGPVKTYIDYAPIIHRDGESWEDFEARREKGKKIARAELPEKFYTPEKVAPELEKRLRQEGASAVAVYRAYRGSILLTDLQVVTP